MFDIVVIGAGPGGYTAALYAARAGLTVLVLEKMTPGGQMGTTDIIDNYPGFPEGVGGFDLAMQMKQGAERFGVKTKMAAVRSVNLNGDVKKVVTAKEEIEARAVIIATGAHPRPLGVNRETELVGKGISYCATCDGMFFKGKDAAVVGGGNTAVSDVLYLAKICRKVYLIHRRQELRASRVYRRTLESLENVELVLDSEVTSLQAEQKLAAVSVKNKVSGEKKDIPVEGLFIAVGNIPNSELFRGQLDMDESGYILADETTRTNIPGVFAVGDVRKKALRQVITAAADGAVASYFAEEYFGERLFDTNPRLKT